MSQNMELLPCPFCGNSAVVLRTNTHAGMSWVACDSCGLEAPTETGVSAEDAVTYWNRRALTATRPDTGDPVSRLTEGLGLHDDTEPELVGLASIIRDGSMPDEYRRSARAAYDFISRLSTAPAGDVVLPLFQQKRYYGSEIQAMLDEWNAAHSTPTPSPQTSPATPDLALIEATARKINPGRSEDHIKSVAMDALTIIRALSLKETAP